MGCMQQDIEHATDPFRSVGKQRQSNVMNLNSWWNLQIPSSNPNQTGSFALASNWLLQKLASFSLAISASWSLFNLVIATPSTTMVAPLSCKARCELLKGNCPGRLETSRGIVEAKHVTLIRRWGSSQLRRPDLNSCQSSTGCFHLFLCHVTGLHCANAFAKALPCDAFKYHWSKITGWSLIHQSLPMVPVQHTRAATCDESMRINQ